MKEEDVKNVFGEVERLLGEQKPKEALVLTLRTRKRLKKNQKWFIGKTYFWENLCYKHLEDIDKSSLASKEGIKIFEELGDHIEISKILRDQGLAQEYLGNYSEALKLLNNSLSKLVENQSVDSLGITLSKIGQIYLHQNKLDKAREYCELGYKICKLGSNKFFLLTSILPLSLVYYRIGNHIAGLFLIEDAEKIEKVLFEKEEKINYRRHAEILLRKSLLQFGSNLFKESHITYLSFLKSASSGEKIGKKYFEKQQEYIEITDLLIAKGLFKKT